MPKPHYMQDTVRSTQRRESSAERYPHTIFPRSDSRTAAINKADRDDALKQRAAHEVATTEQPYYKPGVPS